MLCRDSSCRAYRSVISVEPEGKPGLGLSALSATGRIRPIPLEFVVHLTCRLWAYRCIVCTPRAASAYRVAIEIVSLWSLFGSAELFSQQPCPPIERVLHLAVIADQWHQSQPSVGYPMAFSRRVAMKFANSA